MEPERCIRCRGLDIISDYTTGDVVCRGCGEVQAQRIADQGAEWRSFDDDITGDRVGGDLGGFAERIFGGASGAKRKRGGKHEATGGSLVNKRSKRLDRIRNIAIQVMGEVRKLSLKEEVKNVALKMVDQAFEADEGTAFNGVNETLFTAAVLYLSCKECSVVKTIAEFARLYGLDKYEIGRMINKITDKVQDAGNAVFRPEDVVDKHATQLSLNTTQRECAIETIKKARDLEGMGSIQMQTLSGAVLLLVLMLRKAVKPEEGQEEHRPPVTPDDVARVTCVTVGALRRYHGVLFEKREAILPDRFYKDCAAKGLEPTKDF